MLCTTSSVSVVLFIHLLNIVSVISQGSQLPDSWKLAISLQCEAFSKQSPSSTLRIPLFPVTTTDAGSFDDPMLSLCPPILIWSPIEQWQSVMKDKPVCPVCAVQGSLLAPCGWLDGSSDKAQPRKIHDSRGIILLVSRVYKCSLNHKILGHDPYILEKFPPALVPFFLWHITGVTKELVDDISTLVDAGLPIMSIESLLLRRRRADYIKREAIFLELAQVNKQFPSFDDWSQCFPCMTPGWHVIKTCYQVDFNAKKEFYDKYMQQTTVNKDSGSWLSCDHTFASAGITSCSIEPIIRTSMCYIIF